MILNIIMVTPWCVKMNIPFGKWVYQFYIFLLIYCPSIDFEAKVWINNHENLIWNSDPEMSCWEMEAIYSFVGSSQAFSTTAVHPLQASFSHLSVFSWHLMLRCWLISKSLDVQWNILSTLFTSVWPWEICVRKMERGD